MAVFAISDVHLALSVDKPMDVFGPKWANYMERLETNWRNKIKNKDTVIMPGDISWATYLEDAEEDFRFIHSLPGRKIISKGNHDYWWTTVNKLNGFIKEKGFESISFLHNNSFRVEDYVICGTRGWTAPEDGSFSQEDRKIFNRELQRLEMSIKSASISRGERLVVALHFPPYNSKGIFSEFLGIMQKYGAELCIYGHLHSQSLAGAFEGYKDGVRFQIVSADYLKFDPLKLE